MKKILKSCLGLFIQTICLTSSTVGFAQITITQSDFPTAGDTLRYSVASNAFGIVPGNDGANQSWNFNQLQSGSQYLESFKPMGQAEIFYQFAFGPLSPNPASYFKSELNPITLPAQASITVTDQVNFYRKTSNYFMQSGIGAKLNGFPVPIAYDNPDKPYQFPLTYQRRDTVPFSFNINIPSLGFYGKTAVRTSYVDGYGSLTTSYGTFNCLRVKSIILARDSIFLDTLNFGFGINLPKEIRYTWIAQGEKYPLLDITANEIPFVNIEQVTRVVYRDKFIIVAGINNEDKINDLFAAYPNPCHDQFTMKLSKVDQIVLMNMAGAMVYQQVLKVDELKNQTISIDTRNLSSGMYVLCSYEKGLLKNVTKICRD